MFETRKKRPETALEKRIIDPFLLQKPCAESKASSLRQGIVRMFFFVHLSIGVFTAQITQHEFCWTL
jgi:hypothetical protein